MVRNDVCLDISLVVNSTSPSTAEGYEGSIFTNIELRSLRLVIFTKATFSWEFFEYWRTVHSS